MALKMLEFGQLFSKDENIILDIDEDFFGVEAAETRFEQVRFT